MQLYEMGRKAREAARILATASTSQKNEALMAMARALREEKSEILAANAVDMENGRKQGLTAALLDRLLLTEARIEDMAAGVEDVASLPDPIGEVIKMWRRPNGLEIGRMRVPLGVIGIIYESRPNVTADAASLCLKTGNAILLRGGEEAINSNRAIARIIAGAAQNCGIPEGAIQFVDSASREDAIELMRMNEFLDVLIPRGGKGLKEAVQANATVPVIMTGMGNCHTYVDEFADVEMATRIIINAKTQRPSVCNATETLLVHEKIAEKFLPGACAELLQRGVELRGCERTRAIVPGVKPATEQDWETEYLDLILAIRVVNSLEEAISHINRYGTMHTEAIVTKDYDNARRFLAAVDAACVFVNASTRFTDGFQFGFGAEMGISTQKLHARGPMGLEELTSTKFIIFGSGQIRE
ncbi:MAG: glutamate-5-semialdehyde dehydrogenase [Syntrophothermus sp.]|uniref:glutamate-5-semialdehyde dehydrogenase n=1 Tax=Syntrophothermus sp. TaxID=2736299 RepID=UPI00257AACAC|nr:glutamate-5-semialdehyde dehydrogenase [Syntrophothermus sp.]NSW83561.1 glutamate-5-semialdehyde dehydrogenase [Syntrophothermus sp.]